MDTRLQFLDPVTSAIEKLAARLQPVEREAIQVELGAGRVLAENLVADRPSPPLDVSAMDGYAICLNNTTSGALTIQALPIQATAAAGFAPLSLEVGKAIRIFTGAPIPSGADCVIRREDTTEYTTSVTLDIPLDSLRAGQNIRRQAENIGTGAVVLPAGSLIDGASIGAVASFAPQHVQVRRRIRVAVLNTGDELAEMGTPVQAWQIRDSNGPTLAAWLATLPWVEVVCRARVGDTLAAVRTSLMEQLACTDCIILTGGVSMGDTDFVPEAIQSVGGEIAFHRLPIRPGKPVLGATVGGKLVLGLPGNPVSVAVTSRVIGLPLLRRLAGCETPVVRPCVTLTSGHDRPLDLIWFRLVTTDHQGELRFVHSQGSGDLVSLSHSCGFVEIPAGKEGQGPFRLTLW